MTPSTSRSQRVLVADDDAQMLDAYRRVLDPLASGPASSGDALDDLSAELFGEAPEDPAARPLLSDVVYCRQGDQAVREVAAALAGDRPFAIVFLDMRMPPGMDGLETARRIRTLDPQVNIVVVTGYSEHKPSEIAAAVGRPDKLFYLLKPFDGAELQQLATALATRWSRDIDVAEELARRVAELERMNAALVASEARAHEVARLDALTGLSNRIGLTERFAAGAPAGEGSGPEISVLYLDLDRFKDVNDSHGHAAGDELIREFARRVKLATGEDGFAARLGGDEFAVISTHRDRIAALSARLLAICAAPYAIGRHAVRTSVSIGIAHSDPGHPNLVEAMRRADIALYAAKAAGRGVACEFDPAMERDILGSQSLAEDLAKAIAGDELALHYQPLVAAEGVPISGVEALLRWEHPTKGAIAPIDFIKVAEKTGLIRDLGDWVLRQAFADARLWPDLVTSINLSPTQLHAPGFVEHVAALCERLQVDPHRIEFEITEDVLVDDMARAAEELSRLKALGFRIALDDFGSGYAGLGYLSRIAFDRVKIDRVFVQDLNTKPGAEHIIRSIVALGQALGLSITAEGVEDAAQHRLLREAGCTDLQGFLFHRPQPAADILKLRAPPGSALRTARSSSGVGGNR